MRHYSGEEVVEIVMTQPSVTYEYRAHNESATHACELYTLSCSASLKKNVTSSEFASLKRKQDVKVTRVQRSFCVCAIYVGNRRIYFSGPDNSPPDGLTLRRFGAPPRGDGVKLHRPADFTVCQCKIRLHSEICNPVPPKKVFL